MSGRPEPEVPRPVSVGLRIYRTLAAAFPHEFRNVYGLEMERAAADAVEPVWRRYGMPGLVRLLADIAVRVPVEYFAELRRDLRYGLRRLAEAPAFTAVALVSLALGIGVATAAFTQMNGLVLRDVPGAANARELVLANPAVPYAAFKRFRARTDLFSSTMAYAAPVPFSVDLGGRTERVWGHLVTPSYFPTLGVRVFLGRAFGQEFEQDGQPLSAVVSYRFWESKLGADPAALGRTLPINGHAFTVIGVAPKEFLGAAPLAYPADFWLPASIGGVAPELAGGALERQDRAIFHVVGRLAPGVPAARAEAALDAIARTMETERGDADRGRGGRRITLSPGGRILPIRDQDLPFITTFFTLLGGMILLIACANTVNMTFARATDRRREIAVRLALGASRFRLVRQLLAESMLVAVGAGALGVLFSVWMMRLASGEYIPSPMPVRLDYPTDHRVLLFALALTVLTGLLFGLAPALQATRTDLTPALKEGGGFRMGFYRRLNARNVLVLSEVGGSLALLLITGFLVLGHRGIELGEGGFDASNLYLVSLDPLRDGRTAEQTETVFRRALERVRRLPGVQSVSLADHTPMYAMGHPLTALGLNGAGTRTAVHFATRYAVERRYFEAMRIPVIAGRAFRPEDESAGARVAVISERFATEIWKGRSPLGSVIEVGADSLPRFSLGQGARAVRPQSGLPAQGGSVEIVGVVKNVREGIARASEAPSAIYLPLRPAEFGRPGLRGFTFTVRAMPGFDALAAVRREIRAIDPGVTPFNERSMAQQREYLLFPVRVALWTYGFIGICGLILASVGLAGVSAYSVVRRTHEIGVRVALGAGRAAIVRLIMKEGAALIGAGTLAGLAGAWAGTRALASLLHEIARITDGSPASPVVLGGATLLMAVVALTACYIPARRSTRIDPIVALRQD